jgi:hypothetical protein
MSYLDPVSHSILNSRRFLISPAHEPTAISTALEQLGFEKGSIYHAANVFRTPGHADKWLKALKAKYESQGRPFGREEWDDLLGECSVGLFCSSRCSSWFEGLKN